MQNYTSLSLADNELEHLSSDIALLPKLKHLDLRGNKLTALPDEITSLTQLESLDLRNNRLRSVPPQIYTLQNLNTLQLGVGPDRWRRIGYDGSANNSLSTLPDEVFSLSNLRLLDLSGNQISDLPPQIGKLRNLIELDLSGNQLKSLPAELSECHQIRTLKLGHVPHLYFSSYSGKSNVLTTFPPVILRLTSIRTLHIDHNELTELPNQIDELLRLTELIVNNNKLATLTPALANLQLLSNLDLSCNALTNIPTEIFKLSRLTHLSLRSNQLVSVPPEVGFLHELRVLDLGHNELFMLPKTLLNLVQLETLSLDHNRFVYLIDPDFSNLKSLVTLDISDNKLVLLPPTINSLKNLHELRIGNNKITEIPNELHTLPIANIIVGDNPIKDVPANVRNQTGSLQEYLKQRHNDNETVIAQSRSDYWNGIGFSPRAIELLLRYFDGIDRFVSLRMTRKRPWTEVALTQLFCGIMDSEEQRQEKIQFSLEELNRELAERHAEVMTMSLEIQTHEYPASLERWVTQADIGLVVSLTSAIEPRENWSVPWLLQAKRLYSDGRVYQATSMFRALDKQQELRMAQLRSLVGPFLLYLLYCPRPSALEEEVRTELAILRRRAITHKSLYTGMGPILADDLRLPEPTTAAGLFVSPSDAPIGSLKDVHSQLNPLWTLKGTCPFAWFIISHLMSPEGAVLRTGLTSPARQLAMQITEGRPEVVDAIAQITGTSSSDVPTFGVLPAHTIKIGLQFGRTRRYREDWQA